MRLFKFHSVPHCSHIIFKCQPKSFIARFTQIILVDSFLMWTWTDEQMNVLNQVNYFYFLTQYCLCQQAIILQSNRNSFPLSRIVLKQRCWELNLVTCSCKSCVLPMKRGPSLVWHLGLLDFVYPSQKQNWVCPVQKILPDS